MFDLINAISDAFDDLFNFFADLFEEVFCLCSNTRLSDLYVVRIPIVKLAWLSRLLASIVLILWMMVPTRLVRLRVLARMCFSSTGLSMTLSSVTSFVPSITSSALV